METLFWRRLATNLIACAHACISAHARQHAIARHAMSHKLGNRLSSLALLFCTVLAQGVGWVTHHRTAARGSSEQQTTGNRALHSLQFKQACGRTLSAVLAEGAPTLPHTHVNLPDRAWFASLCMWVDWCSLSVMRIHSDTLRRCSAGGVQ